ncbi:MAG: GNAT family N-acetyltransferase [Candidatus Lokiarchaeota archaeon]|nr:GNAT family N-acetyltransferase [Candidatus Lokiarchaeota archaeon]
MDSEEILIRKAEVSDSSEIVKIWQLICEERMYDGVDHPFTLEQEKDYISSLTERESIFVAIVENAIIGFQSLELWANYSKSFDHVATIGTFVLPEWREMGVGILLANYAMDFARENGFEKVIVYVRLSNKKAQKFYEKLGFVSRGTLLKQLKINGEYDDEMFMEMFL